MYQETGDSLPPGLINRIKQREQIEAERPELDCYLSSMYYHWTELNTCRSYSEVERQIPWTAIKEYAFEFAGITNLDDFEDFLGIIRCMDSVFLKYLDDKRAEEFEKQKREIERQSRKRK